MTYIIITILALLNIGLIWYIRSILNKFVFLSENIDDLFYNLEGYSKHLEQVHEMETYYGDQTLQSLIKHSRDIVNDVQDFKDIYSLEKEELDDLEEKRKEDSEEMFL